MIPDAYETAPPDRRRLPQRNVQRGASMGLSNVAGFGLGGVFTATGAWIVLIGTKTIPVDPASVHAPYWVLTMAGGCFAGAGLYVLGQVSRQCAAGWRRRRTVRLHPDMPALADYPWHPDGFAVSGWGKVAKRLLVAALLTAFLSMFNWWAFLAGAPWPVKAGVGLFDLIVLAVWGSAGLQVLRTLKFGGSRVNFARFPFRLSEPVVLRWPPPRGVERLNAGRFTLRCVEEWHATEGSGEDTRLCLVHDELWSGAWLLKQPRNLLGGDKVELKFEPPAGLPPTNLDGDRATFWELEVKLDLPGLDFSETYLVPVYGARERA